MPSDQGKVVVWLLWFVVHFLNKDVGNVPLLRKPITMQRGLGYSNSFSFLVDLHDMDL